MNQFFKPDEFKCQCGCGLDIRDALKSKLNTARALAMIPFVITSGARCPEHNKNEGGSDTSSHIKGLAVDIACTQSSARARILKALAEVGITRIGIRKDFIHCDIDPGKPAWVVWLY